MLFLSALAYTAKAGLLHGDSYAPSHLTAPSASYGAPAVSHGAPSGSYGAPAGDYGPPAPSHTYDTTHIHSSPEADYTRHDDSHFSGPLPNYSGSGIGGSVHPGSSYSGSDSSYDDGGFHNGDTHSSGGYGGITTSVGAPRVIGSSVSYGRPIVASTRYELQSVVQDVVRRVPIEVTRHVQVAVPVPKPYPVRQEVKVPVPQPYPVHVEVVKHVPYNVYKTKHVEVERPVPYEVVRKVPFEVIRKVHVPVEKPYEVIKKVHVPIKKLVEVPVPVWKPYPIHIIKHVTHYKKKKCCW